MSLSRIFSTLPSNLANNVGKVASVTSSNTLGWIDIDTAAAFATANSASANTIYTQGVDATQNTNISYVTGFAQAAFNAANNVAPQIQPAFDVANSASSNTIHTQGVDETQNARISVAEANTLYLQGALNQTNTDIVTANTSLKSYVDNELISVSAVISGIDATQNTRLSSVEANTVYLQGALNQTNSDIVTANTNLKAYVDNTFFYVSGGNINGPVSINSNLLVTGNLTVSGNVTTVSANNLSVKDNMIYLNANNEVTNPDLGFAGNYNDGTYQHTGFFRDATDGIWKVYDSYLPEPDASPWIDTSNSSFRIADFQANNVHLGQIRTTSNALVANLNSDLLDGQHGSYYAPLSYAQAAFDSANTATAGLAAVYDYANTVSQNAVTVSVATALAYSIALG